MNEIALQLHRIPYDCAFCTHVQKLLAAIGIISKSCFDVAWCRKAEGYLRNNLRAEKLMLTKPVTKSFSKTQKRWHVFMLSVLKMIDTCELDNKHLLRSGLHFLGHTSRVKLYVSYYIFICMKVEVWTAIYFKKKGSCISLL